MLPTLAFEVVGMRCLERTDGCCRHGVSADVSRLLLHPKAVATALVEARTASGTTPSSKAGADLSIATALFLIHCAVLIISADSVSVSNLKAKGSASGATRIPCPPSRHDALLFAVDRRRQLCAARARIDDARRAHVVHPLCPATALKGEGDDPLLAGRLRVGWSRAGRVELTWIPVHTSTTWVGRRWASDVDDVLRKTGVRVAYDDVG